MENKEYNKIHDWIRKNLKGDTCENCGATDKKLDNALKHGFNYEKDINNFFKLCRKCHYWYDHPNGFSHSEEAKKKIGLSQKGKLISFKQRFAMQNYQKGVKATDETKLKMSISRGNSGRSNKKIINKSNGEIFNSAKECSEKLNINYQLLCKMLNNKKPNTTKLQWKND